LPSVFEISLGVVVAGLVPLIQRLGPLGTPAIDDGEREALLERLVALLLSPAGRPELFGSTSTSGDRPAAKLAGWAHSDCGGNSLHAETYLFGNLPALYGSWGLRQLAAE
jgi:hypothetical protein